jgi:hypothetical protein|tara:strand:+ start:140 stop:673 length:534 start_codon:yes stop_codon:yes gene_type:complete
MTPSTDPFEKHIHGLYKGHEVPAPLSAKENVFKKLDDIRIKGYVNKALLATVVSVAAIVWFYSPNEAVFNPPTPVTTPEVILNNGDLDSPVENELQEEIITVPVIELIVEAEVEAEAVEAVEVVEELILATEPAAVPVPAPVQEVVVEKAVAKPDTTEKKAEKSEEWTLGGSIKVEK